MNSLNITDASNLAIHALAVIASKGKNCRLSVAVLAKCLDVSSSHLAKVMQRLVKGKLVDSIRGAKGGFSLRKKPEKITLFQVVKVIDGEYKIASCLFSNNSRCLEKTCAISKIQLEISTLILHRLKDITIADFPKHFNISKEVENC